MTGGRLRLGVLRVGDRVVFDGAEQQVVALSGNAVRLHSPSGPDQVVLLPHLLASPGARLVDAGGDTAPSLSRLGLLDGLPGEVVEAARAWERHVVELETGVPPGSPPEATPQPQYDPARWSLAEREQAKAAELTAAGRPVGLRTVQRMRQRYHQQGLWGLVDQRAVRQASPTGRADPRLLAAITAAVQAETATSTGTRGRLQRRVEQRLAAEHGPGVVAMPSTATFYRLVAVLSQGRHTFGQATTRRSLANRPPRPFTPMVAARPGELVLIDSTPLDVLAVFDDGVTGRAELTAAVDVATRTICAAVLRPVATKAVDAALLLARILVPEPMRPGWAEALAMAHSRLPHQRLLSLDTRLQQAAAKPVVVPEAIIVDRSRVFLSEVFLRACQTLGISVQPARPPTPTDKSVVERTFESINTLFCQHLLGYVGGNVTRRGWGVQAAWTVAELQDLLDEWIVAGWQPRPHEGLRNPDLPGRVLSPNEAYAVLVARAGYLPVSLTGDDYLELLPAEWRSINDYGIQLDYRTYDCPDLDPYRRQRSGLDAKRGLWEVHYDPYDLSHPGRHREDHQGHPGPDHARPCRPRRPHHQLAVQHAGTAASTGRLNQMQPWKEPAASCRSRSRRWARLALANRVRAGVLARYLALYRRAPSAVDDDTSAWTPTTPPRLAVISGQPLHNLTRALPALAPPASPSRPRDLLTACQRCMASQGVISMVVVRDHAHRHLCARHGLWLRATTPVELVRVPAVVRAQRRHARLARRGNPDWVAAAHAAARRIVLDWYDGRWHRDLMDRWQARLHALGVDPWSPTLLPWADHLDAAVYPETVALTGLLASPSWRAHAATAGFYQEAGRRLGIAYPRTSASDPLARWARRTLRDPGSGNGQVD